MPKALIATDGSGYAIDAAKRAKELLAPGVQYTLLTVEPPPVMPEAAPVIGLETVPITSPEAAEELTEAYREEANESLDRTAAALGGSADSRERAARRVEYGDAATEITRVAREEGFDVIVVGSHGSGFVKRVLLGSVSQHLLHHAPCAVLVVQAHDQA
ncbi:MAG: universal stress protein [Acidimicrobiia bacterium]|nr:universal stress protein [Acidimicrobiia bacterium]